ncbi:MAG: molecular chaperone DnaJ [Porticoccaceae bacterium]|jgi:hypothetical protein
MPRLILLLMIGLAFWYGWQYLKAKPPGERRRLLWVYGTSALLIASVLLVATGRMHWLGIAIAALIPLFKTIALWLPRLIPLARILGKNVGPSTFTTRGLTITFNLGTGETSGEIFTGPHAGQPLGGLTEAQLKEQLAFFQLNDRQSSLLLQAYMLRKGFGGFTDGDKREGKSDSQAMSQGMTEEEALQILGLEPGASRDAINKSHKRLIQKLHPDRGGNEYLAAKVNAARDRLI